MLPANTPETRRWVVELFAAGNLAFLAVDIWFAHSMNQFHEGTEWIPFVFSLIAPVLLLPGLIGLNPHQGFALRGGWLVGALSIAVGITGLVLHLRGTFFVEQTFHNLVYTAPFAAPLSYTGLGFLLLLNRTEDPAGESYGQWVLLLAAGGFAGNFALTLADHAQNGFFHASEWLAVLAAAFGFSFLLIASYSSGDRKMLRACGWMMGVQVIIGLLGAALHIRAILDGPSTSLLSNAIHTAPLFAPLLFTDLAILGGIGLWCCASTASGAANENQAPVAQGL